jgi:hypothetical protein
VCFGQISPRRGWGRTGSTIIDAGVRELGASTSGEVRVARRVELRRRPLGPETLAVEMAGDFDTGFPDVHQKAVGSRFRSGSLE